MHLFLNQKQLVSFFLTNHLTENFFLFFWQNHDERKTIIDNFAIYSHPKSR